MPQALIKGGAGTGYPFPDRRWLASVHPVPGYPDASGASYSSLACTAGSCGCAPWTFRRAIHPSDSLHWTATWPYPQARRRPVDPRSAPGTCGPADRSPAAAGIRPGNTVCRRPAETIDPQGPRHSAAAWRSPAWAWSRPRNQPGRIHRSGADPGTFTCNRIVNQTRTKIYKNITNKAKNMGKTSTSIHNTHTSYSQNDPAIKFRVFL